MEWSPEKVYDMIGRLIAAKEKQREEVAEEQSMGDFVSSFFEQVYVKKRGSGFDRTLAQKQLSEFAKAIQLHWAHPDLGPRIHLFGLLCGLLLFEGDHPSKTSTGCFGASVMACDLVLDALRAALNGPKFAALKPLPREAAVGVLSKPWRTTASVIATAAAEGASPSSSSSLVGVVDYPSALEKALKLRRSGPLACSVIFQRDAMRRAQRCSAVQEYEKDRMRSKSHQKQQQGGGGGGAGPAASGYLQQHNDNLPVVGQKQRLMRLLGGADDSHLPDSTLEGRLRQVLASQSPKLPAEVVNSLCDTLWADALQLRQLVVGSRMLGKSLGGMMSSAGNGEDDEDVRRDHSDPLNNLDGLDDPFEAPVQLDGLLMRVLSAWLTVKVFFVTENNEAAVSSSPRMQNNHTDHGDEQQQQQWSDQQQQLQKQQQRQQQQQKPASGDGNNGERSSGGGGLLGARLDASAVELRQQRQLAMAAAASAHGHGDDDDMDESMDDNEETLAMAASLALEAAAKKEEERAALKARRKKEKEAAEAVEKGELIGYQEASAVGFDWGLVFDGQCREVSFEEAKALYRRIRTRPSITLSVRLLSKPAPITVRCAPSDTIGVVKQRVIEQHLTPKKKNSTKKRDEANSKNQRATPLPPPSVRLVGAGLQPIDAFLPPPPSEDDFVLVQFGVELSPEATIEACGLHNNAFVEMLDIIMWQGMLRLKLDQPISTRHKQGAASIAAHEAQQEKKKQQQRQSAGATAGATGGGDGFGGGGSGSVGSGSSVAMLAVEVGRGFDPAPRPSVRLVTRVLLGNQHSEQGGLDVSPEVLKALVSLTAKAAKGDNSRTTATATAGNKSPASTTSKPAQPAGAGASTASVSNAMEILRLQLRVGDRKWKPPK